MLPENYVSGLRNFCIFMHIGCLEVAVTDSLEASSVVHPDLSLSFSIHGNAPFCRHSSLHEISLIRLLAHRAAEGRIQLGGFWFFVSKNGLHGNEWRSLIEQHRCERVSHMGNSLYETLWGQRAYGE